MKSRRCSRCWAHVHIKTGTSQDAPQNHMNCKMREKPDGLFLMSPEQEQRLSDLRFPSSSKTTQVEMERIWWKLLRLLAPELAMFRDEDLAKYISPCESRQN